VDWTHARLPRARAAGSEAPDMANLDLDKTLADLFEAERHVRKLHDQLSDASANDDLATLEKALKAAQAETDEEEASMRLERIALVLGEQEGPKAVDMLIDVLATDFPGARLVAAEQLEGLAYDRFKEVAQGIERALKRLAVGSPALPELPYVIAEVPEPGVSKLLEQFLAHADADAVAAAIEVVFDMGDMAFVPALEKLAGDMRTVEVNDENDEPIEVTLADLVDDALEVLKGGDDELDESETKH
jgi:hypothetical protein